MLLFNDLLEACSSFSDLVAGVCQGITCTDGFDLLFSFGLSDRLLFDTNRRVQEGSGDESASHEPKNAGLTREL